MKRQKRQHKRILWSLLTVLLLLLLTGAAEPAGDKKIRWQFTP